MLLPWFVFFSAGWIALVAVGGGPAIESEFARQRVEVAWQDRFDGDHGWCGEPWHVARPDAKARSTFGPDGGVFVVATPGRAMAWVRTINPVWVADFPILEADYELSGAAAAGRTLAGCTLCFAPQVPGRPILALSDGSTGPVTPGARNPENPLASGGQVQIGSAAPGVHHLVVDLRERFKSDRISQITLVLHSDRQPARLILRRLTLRAANPAAVAGPSSGQNRAPTLLRHDAAHVPARPGDWAPVTLPSQRALSAAWLGRAYGTAPTWPADGRFQQNGIPFHLNPAPRAALATGIMDTDRIQVAGSWRGHELAILLSTRLFGSDQPWYSNRSYRLRGPIESPHRLIIQLEYQDGTRHACFPWSVPDRAFSVARQPRPYIVPLDPTRQLVRFAIVDRMTFGQVFLLAASINRSARLVAVPLAREPEHGTCGRPTPVPVPVRTRVKRNANRLVIDNGWFHLAADIQTGLNLKTLTLVPFARRIVSNAQPTPLVELRDRRNRPLPLQLRDYRVSRQATGAECSFVWSATADRQLRLTLHIDGDREIHLVPELRNDRDAPWRVAIICPQLRECRIATCVADRHYLLGTRNTVLANRSIDRTDRYGGGYPLQLTDVFAPRAGGGLGVMVTDTQLVPKAFQFKQSAHGTDLSVHFPDLVVPAHGRLVLPTAILLPHLGDWHDTYRRYRRWVRQVRCSSPAARMEQVFYCRRDYPVGGTGYLFNRRRNRYTPRALIHESRRGFGGIDMIDISGWAYHEATGRVGNYRTNDLGGLPELKRAVDTAHQSNVRVGLYFEGYLIDRRSAPARHALPAWQLIDKNGQGRWWQDKMELFACPGVEPWRAMLAETIADVAAQTGADAVYLDEFGFAGPDKACWSPDHGHPVPSNPLVEEYRMLRSVRRALDRKAPRTGIYLEQMPCDLLAGLVDGAFDYGMNKTGKAGQPTKLPLHRFVFPEVAVIEMVGHGIRPVPVEVDDLHRCLFHGLAIWLKGRSDSWYTPEFRRVARHAYRILRDYHDVFRSTNCQPLVPTLRERLYANRFSTPGRTVITLYNGRQRDLSGDLLRVRLARGGHVRDLWSDRPAVTRRDGDDVVIQGALQPGSAGVFLLTSQ